MNKHDLNNIKERLNKIRISCKANEIKCLFIMLYVAIIVMTIVMTIGMTKGIVNCPM